VANPSSRMGENLQPEMSDKNFKLLQTAKNSFLFIKDTIIKITSSYLIHTCPVASIPIPGRCSLRPVKNRKRKVLLKYRSKLRPTFH